MSKLYLEYIVLQLQLEVSNLTILESLKNVREYPITDLFQYR